MDITTEYFSFIDENETVTEFFSLEPENTKLIEDKEQQNSHTLSWYMWVYAILSTIMLIFIYAHCTCLCVSTFRVFWPRKYDMNRKYVLVLSALDTVACFVAACQFLVERLMVFLPVPGGYIHGRIYAWSLETIFVLLQVAYSSVLLVWATDRFLEIRHKRKYKIIKQSPLHKLLSICFVLMHPMFFWLILFLSNFHLISDVMSMILFATSSIVDILKFPLLWGLLKLSTVFLSVPLEDSTMDARTVSEIRRNKQKMEISIKICGWVSIFHFILRLQSLTYAIVYFKQFDLIIITRSCMFFVLFVGTFKVYWRYDNHFKTIFKIMHEQNRY